MYQFKTVLLLLIRYNRSEYWPKLIQQWNNIDEEVYMYIPVTKKKLYECLCINIYLKTITFYNHTGIWNCSDRFFFFHFISIWNCSAKPYFWINVCVNDYYYSIAYSFSDESRAETTFSFTIESISKLKDSILSPPSMVRNLPW